MRERLTAPVSVVIPCFRCASTVERAVFSVGQQTVLPKEVILVEDCSEDEGETLDCLHRIETLYRDRLSLRIIRLDKNGGPGVARNAAWGAAKSPYIAFLDADDAWHPKKLELQAAWMEAHPEAVLTGTGTVVRDTLDHLPTMPDSFNVIPVTFHRALFASLLPTRSVMIRACVPNRFVPGKRYSEDYLLWLSLLAEGCPAFVIDLPLAYSFKAEFGEAGLSSHLWRMHCEVLDTYRRLRRAGHLGRALHVVLVLYALLRFGRRVVLSC